jgi:hypothetical protein
MGLVSHWVCFLPHNLFHSQRGTRAVPGGGSRELLENTWQQALIWGLFYSCAHWILYLSVHPSIHPSIHLIIHPSTHPSIHSSIYPSCKDLCPRHISRSEIQKNKVQDLLSESILSHTQNTSKLTMPQTFWVVFMVLTKLYWNTSAELLRTNLASEGIHPSSVLSSANYLPAWPWVSYFISLSFNSLVWEMGVIIIPDSWSFEN